VRAQPFLEGNSFRADTVQVASENTRGRNGASAMNDSHGTQLLPALLWRDPRIHPLDDTWLLTIFTILPAIALPRFVSGVDIDFAATAVGLLGLGPSTSASRLVQSRDPQSASAHAHALGPAHARCHHGGVIWQHAAVCRTRSF